MNIGPKTESTTEERVRRYYSKDNNGPTGAMTDSVGTWKWIEIFRTDTITLKTILKDITDVIVSTDLKRLTIKADFYNYGSFHLYKGTTLYISNEANYYVGYDKTTYSNLSSYGPCSFEAKSGSTIIIDNATLHIRYNANVFFAKDITFIFKNGGKILIDGRPNLIDINCNVTCNDIASSMFESDGLFFQHTDRYYKQGKDLKSYFLYETLVVNNLFKDRLNDFAGAYRFFTQDKQLTTSEYSYELLSIRDNYSYYFNRNLLEIVLNTTIEKEIDTDVLSLSPYSIFIYYELPIPKTYFENTTAIKAIPKSLSLNGVSYLNVAINENDAYFIPSGQDCIGDDVLIINYSFLYSNKYFFDSNEYASYKTWRNELLIKPNDPIVEGDKDRIFLGWYATEPFSYYDFTNKVLGDFNLFAHCVPRLYKVSLIKELYKNGALLKSLSENVNVEYLTPSILDINFNYDLNSNSVADESNTLTSYSSDLPVSDTITSYNFISNKKNKYNPMLSFHGKDYNREYAITLRYELARFNVLCALDIIKENIHTISDESLWYGDLKTFTVSCPESYVFDGRWFDLYHNSTLYENKINCFTNGNTNDWYVSGTLEKDTLSDGYVLKVTSPSMNFNSTTFSVAADEIIQFSFDLQCPNYTADSGLFIGIQYGVSNIRYAWSHTTKTWSYAAESINEYFVYDFRSTLKKHYKTYIIGYYVDISTVPAPETDDESYVVYCLRVPTNATTTYIRTGYNATIEGTYWLFGNPILVTLKGGNKILPSLTNYVDNDISIIPAVIPKRFIVDYNENSGTMEYAWIKYATDSFGNNISNRPEGMSYIGYAINQKYPTPSYVATDYIWEKIVGPKSIINKTQPSGNLNDVGCINGNLFVWNDKWLPLENKLVKNPNLYFSFSDLSSLPNVPEGNIYTSDRNFTNWNIPANVSKTLYNTYTRFAATAAGYRVGAGFQRVCQISGLYYIRLKYRTSIGFYIDGRTYPSISYVSIYSAQKTDDWVTAEIQMPNGINDIYFYIFGTGQVSANDFTDIEFLYIGTQDYSTTILDHSGSSSHGTAIGKFLPVTDGINIQSGYMKVPLSKLLNSYTFSWWQDTCANAMALSSDNIQFYKYGENSWMDPIDEWYHGISFTGISRYMFTVTWDGSTQHIYINGELKASRTHTGVINFSGNLLFGRWQLGSVYDSYQYIGFFGSFVFYDSALSSSEVNNLYKEKILPEMYPTVSYKIEQSASNLTSYTIDTPIAITGSSKAGYIFNKWIDVNGDTISALKNVSKNLYLTAQMDLITYTASFSTEFSSKYDIIFTIESDEIPLGTPIEITATILASKVEVPFSDNYIYTYVDYTFSHWTLDGIQTFVIPKESINNRQYFAVWSKQERTYEGL